MRLKQRAGILLCMIILIAGCNALAETNEPPAQPEPDSTRFAAEWATAFGELPGEASPTTDATQTLFETPVPPPSDTLLGTSPTISDCPVFPADHIWNTPVDSLPVHSQSDAYIANIGLDESLHPDFGAGLWDGGPIGIPYNVVDSVSSADVSFYYGDESDRGPYPIPPDPMIEGGPDSDGDRHILIVDSRDCTLYEIYDAYPSGSGWEAGSGAIWDLNGYLLRRETWTSADAAGLPILPGLVRYDEVASGEIRHALRFTAEQTQQAYVWPARHFASDNTNPTVPPMGARFRLRADFDLSPFPPEIQVILRAMQRYGIILADNGSNWFISGAPDERWDNDALGEAFDMVYGADFEAVDTSSLMIDPNSGQAHQP